MDQDDDFGPSTSSRGAPREPVVTEISTSFRLLPPSALAHLMPLHPGSQTPPAHA